jgi:hypothetical protein
MTNELSLPEFENAQSSGFRSVHSNSEVKANTGNYSTIQQKFAAISFRDADLSHTEVIKSTLKKCGLSGLQESFKIHSFSFKSTHYMNFRTQTSPKAKQHHIPSCYLRRFGSKEDALIGLDSVRSPHQRNTEATSLSAFGSGVTVSGKTIPKHV